MPSQDGAARHLAALSIFIGSYLALAIGKVPGLASTGPAWRWWAPA